jgi:endoribonuclease LACTB2
MTPTFLHAANPGPLTGAGNWTYLIGNRRPVLIDAGVGQPSHLDAIAAAAPDGPALVVVTHAHSDHVSGAPALRERWPAARFQKYPWPTPGNREPNVGWTWLEDGSIIETDEGPLTALLTPGHAPDHLTLWHAESRTVFVGDMMVEGNTVVIPASHGGSLADYLRSLDRILRLKPARALPAHGPVIEDPAALIERYRTHRAAREAQIVEALDRGAATVASIAARIYPGVEAALVPMACETVLAHLQKLESEGRACRDGDRWRLS